MEYILFPLLIPLLVPALILGLALPIAASTTFVNWLERKVYLTRSDEDFIVITLALFLIACEISLVVFLVNTYGG